VTAEVAQQLSNSGLTEVSFSLDGDEDFHNRIRGNRESYRRAIDAVHHIKAHAPGVKIVLNAVIFPSHPHQTRIAVDMAKELKVYAKVQPVIRDFYFSNFKNLPQEMDFSRMDTEGLETLIKYLMGCTHVLNSRYYLQNIVDYFKGKSQCSLVRPLCVLPYFFLEVSPEGIVSPCMLGTGLEGGVSAKEYDSENEKVARLQKDLETCRKCDDAMYICHWEPLVTLPISHFIRYTLLRMS
jgi:MoaA/NifB/PqqE/SkfB family radical SAM enzyme